MFDLKLEPQIRTELTNIAESHGFTNISFDTEYPFEGFRRKFASSRNPDQITYRHLFLNPAIRFYYIDCVLFQKAANVLTLHERMHHLPPFNSNLNVDDYLVQKQACEEYGNTVEMMFLDVLTAQYARVPYLSDDETRAEVSEHLGRYHWIEPNKKARVLACLSSKQSYKTRKLRKILREMGIIPKAKPLFQSILDYPKKCGI